MNDDRRSTGRPHDRHAHPRTWRAKWALLAVLTAFTAGCFSEHASPMDVETELTCADVSPDGRTGEEPVVVIRDFAYHPAELTVSPGTTVTWINCEDPGTAAHTTTADAGVWDSGLLGPGGADVYSRTFEDAGDFPYHCTPHPFMMGRVSVGS